MADSPRKQTKLKKALGLRDLVLLNIACVIGLSSLAQAVQFGWSSFTLWLLAMVCYLIPSGLLVVDLNARVPGEGGISLFEKYPSSVRIVSVLGFFVILLSVILAVIPSEVIENKWLFFIKNGGTTVTLITIGLLFLFLKRK